MSKEKKRGFFSLFAEASSNIIGGIFKLAAFGLCVAGVGAAFAVFGLFTLHMLGTVTMGGFGAVFLYSYIAVFTVAIGSAMIGISSVILSNAFKSLVVDAIDQIISPIKKPNNIDNSKKSDLEAEKEKSQSIVIDQEKKQSIDKQKDDIELRSGEVADRELAEDISSNKDKNLSSQSAENLDHQVESSKEGSLEVDDIKIEAKKIAEEQLGKSKDDVENDQEISDEELARLADEAIEMLDDGEILEEELIDTEHSKKSLKEEHDEALEQLSEEQKKSKIDKKSEELNNLVDEVIDVAESNENLSRSGNLSPQESEIDSAINASREKLEDKRILSDKLPKQNMVSPKKLEDRKKDKNIGNI